MSSTPELWNARAILGERAGTQDLIAAELERRAIERHVKDGLRVLDVGCGNGETAIRLGGARQITIKGVDSAWAMIEVADRNKTLLPFNQHIEFVCADVEQLDQAPEYDLIYTERLIVNLGTWERQRAMIVKMLSWLKPGGTLLLVECSQDGLDGINELRQQVGLPVIVPPSHNRYLRLTELDELHLDLKTARWVNTENYSGAYYLLSRVIGAALAQRDGKEPEYDSPINRLALELPAWITGRWGQGMMFIWEKA